MKYLKIITCIYIFTLVSSVSIFLYIELEPYELNPLAYSRMKGDNYMMFAPLFLFFGICSLILNMHKFISLRFFKGFLFKIIKVFDVIFSIILIISSLLLIFLTDVIPEDNTFAISFLSILTLLSILNLIDSLRLKIS